MNKLNLVFYFIAMLPNSTSWLTAADNYFVFAFNFIAWKAAKWSATYVPWYNILPRNHRLTLFDYDELTHDKLGVFWYVSFAKIPMTTFLVTTGPLVLGKLLFFVCFHIIGLLFLRQFKFTFNNLFAIHHENKGSTSRWTFIPTHLHVQLHMFQQDIHNWALEIKMFWYNPSW